MTNLLRTIQGVALGALLLTAGSASAGTVTVLATAGPWDPAIAGNPSYGVGDQTPATSVNVNAGDSIAITYQSGLVSAFGGVPPSVDALGYVGSIFGSGTDPSIPFTGTGVGSSGTFFPSHAIDPTNTGSPIYLAALIGAFVNAQGVVLSDFATGDATTQVAPAGTVALQLGINDDIFTFYNGLLTTVDNTGSFQVSVTGSTFVAGAVPEPSTWAMMVLGFAGIGFMAYRRKSKPVRTAA